jgi:hypothetical protein
MQLRTLHVEKKVPFWLHLGYNWWDFGETSPLHFQRMRYKQRKFGYDKSKIKGTLLGEENTFRLHFHFHRRILLKIQALDLPCLWLRLVNI